MWIGKYKKEITMYMLQTTPLLIIVKKLYIEVIGNQMLPSISR